MEICQICLKIGVRIFPMTSEDIDFYRTLIVKVEDPLGIVMVCVYCRNILRKLNGFIKQCRFSEGLLRESIYEDSKPIIDMPSQLSISQIEYFYIGPSIKIDEDVKNTEDEDDIPLILLSQNFCDSDNNGELDNSDTTGEDLKMEILDTNLETDILKRRKCRKKKFKKKKETKEGFSSRMVTETDEYIVIKLTKEQILEEMKEQANSNKYKMLPYKCEKCVKGFNFEDVLQSHLDKHVPKNGYLQCELCTQYCPSKVSLRGHMKSHSTRYKCKLCGLVRLSRQHVLEHYSLQHSANGALYSCPRCDHTTDKRTAMQRHVRLHSASEPLKCHLCGKYYKSKESLRVHVMRHDNKKLHHCELCSSTFVYATQLNKHMQSVHERKDYYCVECDIMFKSMDNLKQHLQRAKRHRDDSSYKYRCTECEQKFISSATLATHRTNAHGAAKSESCAICARHYSSAEALRWHVRRAHMALERAKLPCPLCDRMFSRKYILRVHMRTHTGEKPHKCQCGAAFAQSAALRAHRASAHKMSSMPTDSEG